MYHHKLKSLIRSALMRLIYELKFSYQFSHGITPTGSVVIAFAYVSSYYFEQRYAEMHFDTLVLRIAMALLFLTMMSRQSWPISIRSKMPYIWILFLTIVLPYCYGSILIMDAALSPPNSGLNIILATEYVLSSFFLVQLVFHVPLILIIWLAANLVVLSQLTLLETVNFDQVSQTIFFILPFFLTVLLIGGLINRRLFLFQREKEKAVSKVANAIAHQLRTPLATIRNLASGTEDNLPKLITSYHEMVKKGLVETPIPKPKLNLLKEALNSINEEVRHSNALIDILIANSRPFEHLSTPSTPLDIAKVIDRAAKNYPYNNPIERNLVSLDPPR